MAPIRSTTSIRSERLSQQVPVACDAVDEGLSMLNIVGAVHPDDPVSEAPSSIPSTPSDASSSAPSRRRHVASHLLKPDHIRRPANQFMIYLSERRKEFKDKYPNCKSNDLNKHVSVQWNKLSSQEKEPYKKKSLEVAERHKAQHPGYEYKPMLRRKKQKRGKGKKGVEEKAMTIAQEATFILYSPPTRTTPEPEVATPQIATPALTFPIPDVFACAQPLSYPAPVVPQYDFADGTMRPPQSIQVGPQMRPEANANTPWYPHGMPMVNVDSDFSLGSELGMSDFSNLDDGVTLSLFDAGYYRYPSGGPIGGFGLGPGASNFDDGATPPLHNTDEYFDFGAFPS